ncbi:hypothetical protein F2Q68_00005099 [Brassica cretica]|uniref:Uncharacterized protein n=1 Tax=Brassica cretica TaxID=69181 RepID=A0A8S9JAW0_BRACR|nr:hypothetical protein F2Q68_00005099 [Brassica cretica]
MSSLGRIRVITSLKNLQGPITISKPLGSNHDLRIYHRISRFLHRLRLKSWSQDMVKRPLGPEQRSHGLGEPPGLQYDLMIEGEPPGSSPTSWSPDNPWVLMQPQCYKNNLQTRRA